MSLELVFVVRQLQRIRTPITSLLGRQKRSDLWYSTASNPRLKPVPEWEEEPKKRKKQQSKRWLRSPPTSLYQYLKWTPLPLFALLAYKQYRRLLEVEHSESIRQWQITCYRMMPWRALSKAWGWINAVELPLWARNPFLSWYIKAFGCDVSEAEIQDLCYYKNLGEFFRRSLKEGVRPLCPSTPLVSPVDGRVLNYGKVDKRGIIEQVKGVNYSLAGFLGTQSWNAEGGPKVREDYLQSLLSDPDRNSLYHIVIYLAPGDYHRFHSPTDWTIKFRRHFAGELLSVNPAVARWISGLFSLNERAVYIGNWEHGFFSMSAVGATNVGSIRVYGDKELLTNCWAFKKNTFRDKKFPNPLVLKKGEEFGEFNLGSTMVILFEAPSDFEFCIETGSKIQMGQALFQLPKKESKDINK